MTLTGLTGTTYVLDPVPIGSGGEGDVYRVLGGDGKVAKLYKPGAITQELVDKLMVMIHYPPSASVLSQVAWPLDLVGTEPGTSCGFVMPELSINTELGEVYKYPATLPISMHQKINIAQNICVAISEVHKAGYVFGDFNPRNIGLDINTGLVSFLDTDTYHVEDKEKGTIYRCNVCASGYAAPELLGKCSDYVAEVPAASKNAYAETPLPTFTKETDNFALAIHIFKLLMNGYTPFGGIIETASVSQSSPGVGDAAVRRDSYCFKPGYKHQSAAIPPLEALPQEIADLFTRAFIVGKGNPRQRPDAVEWHKALSSYEQSLINCADNPLHQYDRKNSSCPFCEADRLYAAAVGGTATAAAAPLKQAAYASPLVSALPQTPQPMQPAYAQPSSDPSAAIAQKSNKSIMIAVVTAVILIAIIIPVTFLLTDGWGSQSPAPNPQRTRTHDNQMTAGGGQTHGDGSGHETTPPTPPTQPPVSPPQTPPPTPPAASPAAPAPVQVYYYTEADVRPVREPKFIHYGRWNFIAPNPAFSYSNNFVVGNMEMRHGIGTYIASADTIENYGFDYMYYDLMGYFDTLSFWLGSDSEWSNWENSGQFRLSVVCDSITVFDSDWQDYTYYEFIEVSVAGVERLLIELDVIRGRTHTLNIVLGEFTLSSVY